MKKTASPKPVAVTTVCSMCGLGWELHGEDPTTEDCIRLLKVELARRPVSYPINYPFPYVQPVPMPAWPKRGPYWQVGNTYCQTDGTANISVTAATPRVIQGTCSQVTA